MPQSTGRLPSRHLAALLEQLLATFGWTWNPAAERAEPSAEVRERSRGRTAGLDLDCRHRRGRP